MSTYSPSLRIELITTGTQAGTWGQTTNDNLSTVLEASIAGNVAVSVVTANQALTYLNGPTSTAASNQSVRAILTLSTTTGANFAIYAPPVSKQYTIYNSSAYTATVYNSTSIGNTTAAGLGVAIPAGEVMTVWSDGTNFYQQNTALISPHLSGTPTTPTASAGTNTTQIASTAFVATAITNATAALGTMSTQNANNVAITGGTMAGVALSGTNTGSTQALNTADTSLATTAFVDRLRNVPGTSTTSTLAITDRGSCVRVTAGITVPASVFSSGDVVSIYNNSSSIVTITQGSGLTLRFVGTANTGSRTLSGYGLVTVMFISATEAVISGGGLA